MAKSIKETEMPNVTRKTLSQENFRHLVRGGTLVLKTHSSQRVEITLSDIGFETMDEEVRLAFRDGDEFGVTQYLD